MTDNVGVDAFIGRRIRQLRRQRRMSGSELAAAIGTSYQQVHKYEYGQNRVSAATLDAIARFFDVPYSDFFEDSEERGGRVSSISVSLDSLDSEGRNLVLELVRVLKAR